VSTFLRQVQSSSDLGEERQARERTRRKLEKTVFYHGDEPSGDHYGFLRGEGGEADTPVIKATWVTLLFFEKNELK
jgi:hypothetical protein